MAFDRSHTSSYYVFVVYQFSQSEILVENRDYFIARLHLRSGKGGPCRNIAIRFGVEKLKWCD